jgi:hypothetical protein
MERTAVSHRQPDKILGMLTELPFTGAPLAFYELDNGDAHAMPKRTKSGADSGRGFALAIARIDKEKASASLVHCPSLFVPEEWKS